LIGLDVLSPGGLEVDGKDEVPLFRPQYPANTACADATSAVCEEQEYLADVLIFPLTRREF
jgi:hypothetical protein